MSIRKFQDSNGYRHYVTKRMLSSEAEQREGKRLKLKYRCPHCGVNSYSKHWNSTTRMKYGDLSDGEICEIQEEESNSYHLCPKCNKESEWFKGALIIDSTESA